MQDHDSHKDKPRWKRAGLVLSVTAIELSAIYGFSQVGETSTTQEMEESSDTANQTDPAILTSAPSLSGTTIPSHTMPVPMTSSDAVVSSETLYTDPAATTETGSVPEASTAATLTSAAGTEATAVVSEPIASSSETSAAVCDFVIHGNTEYKEIAFTFDDKGDNLARILEILDARGIKGNFFLLAGELEKNPELWQTAAANGHLILNHTVHHYVDLSGRSEETIKNEILGWEDTAKEVLGEEYLLRMKADFPYFRTPGGGKSNSLTRILGELGYTKMVYWTVEDIYFSSHNPDNISIVDHYVQEASNGAIFLLHPGDWSYVADIIDRLAAEGYTFVTVPELFD